MKDEIKEILDEYITNEEWIVIATNVLKYLKDYITNLQEKVDQYENPDDLTLFYMWLDEKAKDKIKQLQEDLEKVSGSHFKLFQENKKLQDRNIELVLERDRLKELCNAYEEEHSTTFEYWKQLVKEDYKSRNEKAIKYINEYQEILKEHNGDWLNYQDGFKPYLLNILNGGDDNE